MNKFNGSDYIPERDDDRLECQYARIFQLMKDGKFRTLSEIATRTHAPPNSVSAQLRHMRKPRFGSHTVNKTYVNNGLFKYQLIVNSEAAA